ncbi:MAG: hypothetical protein FWE12_03405 [Oscillospiraceae bacterium]|nr:hypothetical protein [Oscillospiraceae bacterium]
MHEQRHPEHHRHPMEHPHHPHHHMDHRHAAMDIDRRYPELYHRMMPYIEDAHMAHRDIGRMSPDQLHVLADRAMRDSGVLHHMPPGYTEDTVRDMVKMLLLTMDDSMTAMETFRPLAPLALGLGPWGWGWPYGFVGPWFPYRRGFRRGHGGGFRGGHRGRR